MAQAVMDRRKLARYVTLEVTVKRDWRYDLRCRVGLGLIRLGAWLCCLSFEVNEMDGDLAIPSERKGEEEDEKGCE